MHTVEPATINYTSSGETSAATRNNAPSSPPFPADFIRNAPSRPCGFHPQSPLVPSLPCGFHPHNHLLPRVLRPYRRHIRVPLFHCVVATFHEIQFSAPPLRTASKAGTPITLQRGIAAIICCNACSSSGIPNCGTKTRLPICKKLMYAQLRSCFRFTLYISGITSTYFSNIFRILLACAAHP